MHMCSCTWSHAAVLHVLLPAGALHLSCRLASRQCAPCVCRTDWHQSWNTGLYAPELSLRALHAEHTFIRYAFSLPTFFMLLGLLCTFAGLPITIWILAGP